MPVTTDRHLPQTGTERHDTRGAGDMIDNLYWRLLHAGQTPALAPKVAVLLVGTNDFGAVDTCFGDSVDLLDAVTGIDNRCARFPCQTDTPLMRRSPAQDIPVMRSSPAKGHASHAARPPAC